MRALVTGGAGFIGSHIVDALLDRGDEVAILDHLSRRPRPWVTAALQRDAQLHVGDVRDLQAVRTAFEEAMPEVVLHLAAQVDVRRSVADPAYDAQVNVAGTVSILEAARETGVRRVVMASTAAVYGDPARLPIDESFEISPLSPYGTAKAAAEWYLAQYTRLHDISTLALRMSNVYGPRQDPHGEAGVVAIFCGAANGHREVTVFGDGRQTRDYIYVRDVVAAWIAAADAEQTGALNVSTGQEATVLDLVDALGLRANRAPGRPGEISRSCLSPALAEGTLGWRAQTPLLAGLEQTRASLAPEGLDRSR
jgi:UDP-glucose 4-epimerase